MYRGRLCLLLGIASSRKKATVDESFRSEIHCGGMFLSRMVISPAQARRFLIRRQGFKAYASPFAGLAGVREAISALGAVQIDPINPFSRNHDHVLYSRVAGYSPVMLDRLLYDERFCFEYYCNALCVLPMAEYPYFAYRMHMEQASYQWSPELAAARVAVLDKIKEEGSFLSRDMRSNQRTAGWWDGGEATSKVEKVALDILHYTGQVMIAARQNGQRRYDLPERIVPEGLLQQRVHEGEWREFMVEKFIRSYGLSQARLFRFGWTAPKSQAKATLKGLICRGNVVEVNIEGVKRIYYCHRDDLPSLTADLPLPEAEHAVFVAPLDNFLWDRDRLLDLFSFHYRWEVYTPPAKRSYGYYVLPVLYGENLVGRIELKAQREKAQLQVVNLWLDDARIGTRDAVWQTAQSLAAYLDFTLQGL